MDRNLKILVVSAVALLFVIFTVMSNSIANNYPDYTVYSTNTKGTALLFDTLKGLGYPVKISRQPIYNLSNNDVCIIVEPNKLISDDYIFDMLDWVYYGGTLILLTPNTHEVRKLFLDFRKEYLDMLENMNNEKQLRFYDLGDGLLALGGSNGFLNVTLLNDRQAGYELVELLSYLNYDNIYFNEYYHGYSTSQSLFNDIPFGIKLIFYQFLIVILLVIIYLGKRFGRVIPYYENEERIENEYVVAVANLYQEAGLYDVIIENYYNDFINRTASILSRNDSNMSLLDVWKQKNLPRPEYLSEVQDYINDNYKLLSKNKKCLKQFISIISKINYLNNVLINAKI